MSIDELDLSQGKLELYFLALIESLHAFFNLKFFQHQYVVFVLAVQFLSYREMRFYKNYCEDAQQLEVAAIADDDKLLSFLNALWMGSVPLIIILFKKSPDLFTFIILVVIQAGMTLFYSGFDVIRILSVVL